MDASLKNRTLYYQLTIFLTLFIGYALYGYNRKSVSFAMPKLMDEGLTKSDAGLIISSQNMAYAISKFIGGVLSDRISARILFSWGLIISGLTTIVFSNCDSVLMFTLLWFLNGFAQGSGWPSCAKILRQWYSPAQFGTYWSILSASSNISGSISPFVSAFIIINYGWRFSLLMAGIISIIHGCLSFITLVNTPNDVNLPNFVSVQKVTQKKSDGTKSNEKLESWRDIITSPFLWFVSICYMSVFCTKTSAVDWGQLYLIEDRKHSQFIGSSFTSSVESGGFIGGIFAGYLTDIASRRAANSKTKSVSNPRIPIAILMNIGICISLHLLYFYVNENSSQLFITSIGFVMGACLYGPIAIYGVVATESAPTHLSGTAHAIVALAANVGAITSGLPFSIIAKHYQWSSIFLLLEIVTALTVIFMIIGKSIPSNIGKVKRN